MNKVLLLVAVLMMGLSSPSWAADVEAGKAKSAQCAACHGTAGISPMGIYPNLAGQKEPYLVKQINAFRLGVRKDPTMQAMVGALSDADVVNIAAYYASIK